MTALVLTTDLSEESKRAFGPACELARGLGLPVLLLGVVVDLPFEPVAGGLAASYPDREQIVADWRQQVGEVAAGLGPDVTAHVVEGADVPLAICRFAGKHDAQFICMATHGRSGLARLLIGSVAEAVLRQSKIPVLAIPPPGE